MKKSFGGKKIETLLKGTKKNVLIKLSLEKEVCAFEWCLVLSQKYTKSFGGKNRALCKGFVSSKVKVYV